MSDLVPKTFAWIKLTTLMTNGLTRAVQNADPAKINKM
jgi:hypothetical protein